MSGIKLYGDAVSGNCLKAKWTLDFLNISHEWVSVDILKNQTRSQEFLAQNPLGQVPCVVFPDGNVLCQSNAIVLHFAESAGSALLPNEAGLRAKVYEWMFWEQNSHEPYVAGRRFRKAYLKQSDDEISQDWLPRGNAALAHIDAVVAENDFLIGSKFTAADIVVVAYTRCAGEGGFKLADYPNVECWIARVENTLGLPAYGAA